MPKDVSFYRSLISLYDLIVNQSIVKGNLYLSSGTRIDTDECMCVTAEGLVKLVVPKETYNRLGVVGKRSTYASETWIITIDVFAPHWKPGKAGYERTMAMLSRLKPFVILSTCEIKGALEVEKLLPSLELYSMFNVQVPQWKVADQDRDETLVMKDVLTWSGAVSCRLFDLVGGSREQQPAPSEFVSSYHIAGCYDYALDNAECVTQLTCTGLLQSEHAFNVLNKVRQHVKEQSLPWAVLIGRGFENAPVAWGDNEHSKFLSGDYLYAFYVQPDDVYWGFVQSGQYDNLPI